MLKIDNSIRERLMKRIERMEHEPPGRHLMYGLGFFVVEVGQYRVVYKVEETTKTIFFVGTHKDYEKWFRSTQIR